MAHERVFGREKKSKEDEINLSRYSRNLSRRLLSADSGIIQPYISQSVLEGYQAGSIKDRSEHWDTNLNFGQQMTQWIGKGQGEGLSTWIDGQKDERVMQMLHLTGLIGNEPVADIIKNPDIAALLTTINADLQKTGEEPLTADNLSESQARSLLFYANYFSGGEKNTDQTKSLIDTLIFSARQLTNDNPEQALEILQKVSPLLALAGEEAQETLGALLITEMHTIYDEKGINNISQKEPLTSDEERIITFLTDNGVEFPDPESVEPLAKLLRLGEKYSPAKVFAELRPAALGKNPYIVERVPDDSAKKLESSFGELEQSDPLFLDVQFVMTPQGLGLQQKFNRDAFDPAYTLEHNGRFKNGEALTKDDSGLFALAAASAKTPEEQAKLYHQLADVVVAVHEKNPELLEKFLRVQTTGSGGILANNDAAKENKALDTLLEQTNENLERELASMKGQPEDVQRKHVQDADAKLALEFAAILKNFSGNPDRLVSVQHIEPAEDAVERFPLEVLIPETIQGWKESGRIEKLSRLLKEENPEFTPEEIRQIEFLAHSVDVVKVIKWMQNNETFPIDLPDNSPIPTPETSPVVPSPQGAPAEVPTVENENRAAMTLEEFFNDFKVWDDEDRRGNFLEGSPLELAEFRTNKQNHEEITHFENIDSTGSLAIFSFTDSGIELGNNPFFNLMEGSGSLSKGALDVLPEKGYYDAVLLAFSLEAAKTAPLQANVFKNLFLQIVNLYNDNPDLYKHFLTYARSIQDRNAWEKEDIDFLLGDSEKTKTRLNELAQKLRDNEPLVKEDIHDMNFYALPLNLQHLAARMRNQYDRDREVEKATSTE